MNIKTIEQNMEANVYGEQSIVSDELGAFLWNGYKTYVVSKLGNKVLIDQILKGAGVVEDEETSLYNDSVDFPYISYIPNTFTYAAANPIEGITIASDGMKPGETVETKSLTFDASSSYVLEVLKFYQQQPTDRGICRFDLRVESDIHTWEYIVVVSTTDTLLLEDKTIGNVEYKIYPRKITSNGTSAETYYSDKDAPQFYNSSESLNTLELQMYLPQKLGKSYTVTFAVRDYFAKGGIQTNIVGAHVLPHIVKDQYSSLILTGPFNAEDINVDIEADTIELEFERYSFTDLEMGDFITYLTAITNMTSDEYNSGMEQYNATQTFNSKILSFPMEVYKTMPIELKNTGYTENRRGSLNSGTVLSGRRY